MCGPNLVSVYSTRYFTHLFERVVLFMAVAESGEELSAPLLPLLLLLPLPSMASIGIPP